MRRLSKQNRILMSTIFVLMIMVIMGITYAAFTGSLSITGQGVVRNSSWDIHIVEEGELEPSNTLSASAKVLHKPSVSGTSISEYSVSLTTPGDSISYTFNVINEGNYNAKISSVNISTPECTEADVSDTQSGDKVCAKLHYTLKYISGTDVAVNDMILSKETKTLVLTLKYDDFNDPSLLPTSDVTISNLAIEIQYAQEDNAVVNESDGSTPKEYATYSVGTEKTINGELYYVIGDKGTSSSYVTLLKADPLTVDEVNEYGGVGTANNQNGYGGMAYSSSETCGWINNHFISNGCTTDYNQSDIKYTVDVWASEKFTNGELASDTNGYKARLITIAELENLGYGKSYDWANREYYPKNDSIPSWAYSPNGTYWYWTMSPWKTSSMYLWYVHVSGNIYNFGVDNSDGVVRPVINVYKSKL